MPGKPPRIRFSPGWTRGLFWGGIAVYVAALPFAIFGYRFLVSLAPARWVGRIPGALAVAMAVAYALWALARGPSSRAFLYLALAMIPGAAVLWLVPMASKHIHLPEYILLAWLLFFAIRIDHRGSGASLLVLVCAALLGVVDEILQGLLPGRYFGWQDMAINAASALAGVLAWNGAHSPTPRDWGWTGGLSRVLPLAGLALAGLAAVPAAVVFLWQWHLKGGGPDGYPGLLLFFQGAFAALLPGRLVRAAGRLRAVHGKGAEQDRTLLVWLACPAVIAAVIHLLALTAVFITPVFV